MDEISKKSSFIVSEIISFFFTEEHTRCYDIAGASQNAPILPSDRRLQHAVASRPHSAGDEHRAAVHESAWLTHTRSPGEQQLRLHQHQHRPWGLRVVRMPLRVLGHYRADLQKVGSCDDAFSTVI